MSKFYPKRTLQIFPIYIFGTLVIFIICIFVFLKELMSGEQNLIVIYALTFVVMMLLLPYPLIKESDKAGYYLSDNKVVWRNNFSRKNISLTEIEGVIILNNTVYKSFGFSTLTPTLETIKTEHGEKYVYAMTLVKDLSKININYTSNELFVRDHKNIAIGSAIYNEEFIESLLKVNNNIKVIKAKGCKL